jgi:replication factor C subunit 1
MKGKIPLPVGQKNCLKEKTFLITGVLDSLEREEATKLIQKYGG